MEKIIIYLKRKKKKKHVHSAARMTLLPVLFQLIGDKILYNIFYTVSLGSQRMYFFLPVATMPVSNVLGKCWKVAHRSAKKLLRKVLRKFLDIFYIKRR